MTGVVEVAIVAGVTEVAAMIDGEASVIDEPTP